MGPILSLFPGIGLLERPFADSGFTIYRGPDLLFGQTIHGYTPPPDSIWGILAGPPCHDFSQARRAPPTGNGRAMLAELARIITATNPVWYLVENVPRVPDIQVPGFHWQRVNIDAAWFTNVSRPRVIQYGYRYGKPLYIPPRPRYPDLHPAATTSDPRTFRELCRLQGLPEDFDLPAFTVQGKKTAVANGVPYCIAAALTLAVISAHTLPMAHLVPKAPPAIPHRLCPCHCGQPVTGAASYATPACRKRAQRQRQRP